MLNSKIETLRKQRLRRFKIYANVSLKGKQLMDSGADFDSIVENAGRALVRSADYIEALENEMKALYEIIGEDAFLSTKIGDFGPIN